MKVNKGYLPRVTGRPGSDITTIEVESPLEISLVVAGRGYRPLVKAASTVCVVIEQFLRLLIHAGLPATDVDLIHCRVFFKHDWR